MRWCHLYARNHFSVATTLIDSEDERLQLEDCVRNETGDWLRESDCSTSERIVLRWVQWLVKTDSYLLWDMRRLWDVFTHRRFERKKRMNTHASTVYRGMARVALRREYMDQLMELKQALPLTPPISVPSLLR